MELNRVFLVLITTVGLLLFYYHVWGQRWSTENQTLENSESNSLHNHDLSNQTSNENGNISSHMASEDICQSLFTITRAHSHQNIEEKNIVFKMETDVVKIVMDILNRSTIPDAKERVRLFNEKRDSIYGLSTDDYASLAELLPKLLFYGNVSHLEANINSRINILGRPHQEPTPDIRVPLPAEMDRRKSSPQNPTKTTNSEYKIHVKSPFFLGRSRVEATGGVVPYVPCRLDPYRRPATFLACVRRRIEATQGLRLHFMGDSKIRDVFERFMNRTDPACHYSLWVQNRTFSWSEAWKHLQVLGYNDIHVTTPLAPRLTITYMFRWFRQTKPSLVPLTQEVKQLQRWAEGGEAPPDLLILGYTTWMIVFRDTPPETQPMDTLDGMDALARMHATVVPLLQQISRRARVLVLSQSRFHPYALLTPDHRVNLNSANFDWSEMTFRYLARQYNTRQKLKQAKKIKETVANLNSQTLEQHILVSNSMANPDSQMLKQYEKPSESATISDSHNGIRESVALRGKESVREYQRNPLKTSNKFSIRASNSQSPVSGRNNTVSSETLPTGLRRLRTSPSTNIPDHLTKRSTTNNENTESSTLNSQTLISHSSSNNDENTNPSTHKYGPLINHSANNDKNTKSSIHNSEPLTNHISSNNWDNTDTTPTTIQDHPSSSNIDESTESTLDTFRDHLHPSISSSPGLWWWDSVLPLNLASHGECLDLLRHDLTSHAAYRGRMLACLDSHHAGSITNHDLVTMLLNLLCNAPLRLEESYCCS